MLTIFLVSVGVLAVLVGVGVWAAKRKLADMGQHLPGALQQWEKEIEKLEKPKG